MMITCFFFSIYYNQTTGYYAEIPNSASHSISHVGGDVMHNIRQESFWISKKTFALTPRLDCYTVNESHNKIRHNSVGFLLLAFLKVCHHYTCMVLSL